MLWATGRKKIVKEAPPVAARALHALTNCPAATPCREVKTTDVEQL